MSTNLVPHAPTVTLDVAGPPSPLEWQALREQAQVIVASGMAPKAVNTAEKVLTIALKGRELRVPPMQALSQIHIVEGKPTLSAELMVALVQRAGHKVRILETSSTVCRVQGVRADDPDYPVDVTFTIEDAQRAKVAGKGVWQQYPDAMLRARAISALCRAVFADVLMGASYTPEELGAEVDGESGEVISVEVEHAYLDPAHRDAMDELEGLLLEAEAVGIEGDHDATRRYAGQGVEYARVAIRKVRAKLDRGGGDGGGVVADVVPDPDPDDGPDDDGDVVDAEVVDDSSHDLAAGGDGEAPPAASNTPDPDDEPEDGEEDTPAAADGRRFFAILRDLDLDYQSQVRPWMVDVYGVSWSKLAGTPEATDLLDKLGVKKKREQFVQIVEEHAAQADGDDVPATEAAPSAVEEPSLAERALAHAEGRSQSLPVLQERIRRAWGVLAVHNAPVYEAGWERARKILGRDPSTQDWSGASESKLAALASDMDKAAAAVEAV